MPPRSISIWPQPGSVNGLPRACAAPASPISPTYAISPALGIDRGALRCVRVLARDVVFDQPDEILRDVLAAQRHGFLAVDEHRRRGRFTRAGERDADVRVLRFARPV